MELCTNDLILRPVTEADLSEIARMWRYPDAVSLEAARKALQKMESRHSQNRVKALCHLCLAVFRKEAPREIIGWCGWDGQIAPGEAVLFYSIAEPYRCRGYATQCARALLRYIFEDMQYDRVSGGCAKDNIASFRVMEKAGMCHNEIFDDGGLGFYMDRQMYLNLTKGKQIAALATDEAHIVMWDMEALLADHEGHPYLTVATEKLVPQQWLTLDKAYALTTDASKPIILFELPNHMLYIADGNHRLYKAAAQQIPQMNVIILPEEKHLSYLYNSSVDIYRHAIRGLQQEGIFISERNLP